MNAIKARLTRAQNKPKPASKMPSLAQAQRTSYTSRAVDIPSSFLTTPAFDAKPITVEHVDFSQTDLKEYAGLYAVVLDNVLSPSECTDLLSLAEQSAPNADQPWQPALVNVGGNYEVRVDDYRKSDRIIWDQRAIVDRIVKRCMDAADGRIGRELATISNANGNAEAALGEHAAEYQTWAFTRGNERMRFLRYEPGCFFDRHCDGSYESLEDSDKGKPYERTIYTLHLYLNGEGVEGGETTFWNMKWKHKSRRVDVKAVRGRVLIFQHRGLLHSGEEVKEGVKFTMRTDLLYKRTDLDGSSL